MVQSQRAESSGSSDTDEAGESSGRFGDGSGSNENSGSEEEGEGEGYNSGSGSSENEEIDTEEAFGDEAPPSRR